MKPKTKLMAAFLIGILAANIAIAYNYIDSITHETVGEEQLRNGEDPELLRKAIKDQNSDPSMVDEIMRRM